MKTFREIFNKQCGFSCDDETDRVQTTLSNIEKSAELYAKQFHPSPKENECRHNMFSVYSLNNFDSGGKSSWGLHKCAQCGKEEPWQYDHV